MVRRRFLKESANMDPNIVIFRQPIADYCADAHCDPEDISMKDGGEYVYTAYEGDNPNTGFPGSYAGVEYSDGTFSIVGLRVDKICSFADMMNILIDEFRD